MKCKCGNEIDGTKANALVANESKVVCHCGMKYDHKEFDFQLDWSSFVVNIEKLQKDETVSVWAEFKNSEAKIVKSARVDCKSDAQVIVAIGECSAMVLPYV